MTIGIYKIANTKTNQVYIGQSLNIERRFQQHKTLLRNNKSHNSYLQNSFNKYGEECFEWEILEMCSEQSLNNLETKYIIEFNSTNKKYGFNNNYGGDSKRPTLEWRNNMSKKMSGRKLTEDARRKISESRTGYIVSEDVRRKYSLAQTKRWENDKNTRKKFSIMFAGKGNPFYGKTHTKETRDKMSEYAKNRSEEHKINLSKAHKGKNLGKDNPSAKRVRCITTNEVFETMKDAGKKYNINPSDICACCKGRQKSAGKNQKNGEKLFWEYY